MSEDLALLVRSLPYLRPSQVPQRAWRLMAETAIVSTGSIRLFGSAPLRPDPTCHRTSPRLRLWDLRPTEAAEVASEAAEGRFELLGENYHLEEKTGWSDPHLPRLARFELNSFDFAWAMQADDPVRWGPSLARLIQEWHVSNPPGRSDPWHPFVVAERLINLLGTRSMWQAHVGPDGDEVQSLYRQARFLRAAMERDVGGNHLIREGLALMLAGRAFGHGRLWASGRRVVVTEAARQVLPDGGHVERSPSYHLEVLTDLVEAARLLPEGAPDRRRLEETSAAMASFAVSMCHPDGQVALFNDCYLWPVPPADYIRALGLDGRPATSFPDSGYFVLGQGEDRLFMDAGPPSPQDLPPHAHCDLLSIEASVGGERFIVNSGTGSYERGPWRDYWRSTRAHSTVEIDGAEQSEVWHSFRMARRATPKDVALTRDGGTISVTGAHDGYSRLSPPCVHRRTVIEAAGGWLIADSLEGHGRHRVRSFLHLHPDVAAAVEGPSLLLRRGRAVLRLLPMGHLPFSVREASEQPVENWYAERLGTRTAGRAVLMEGVLDLPATLGWALLPTSAKARATLEAGRGKFKVTVETGGAITEMVGEGVPTRVRSIR